MNYYFNKILQVSFDDAVQKTIDALSKEGFGIISDIDIKDAMKKKLDIDFRDYRILGACSPKHAYEALQNEDKIGTMLPCNVIVQQIDGINVEIAAIDPIALIAIVENDKLGPIASEIQLKLKRVIDSIG